MAIDGHEGRDVAIMDIPGTYLHAINDKFIIIHLKGKIAEMICRVNPQLYRKYVTVTAKGEPTLYIKLNKALYGLLRSALLWYKKMRDKLEKMGFATNPYDSCCKPRSKWFSNDRDMACQ